MASKRIRKNLSQNHVNLVVCEGECEEAFLKSVLDLSIYKVMLSKRTDAKSLVCIIAHKANIGREYVKIYCVFDKDNNTESQLKAANKYINEQKDKYIRVFSNPCFEIVLWFNFNNRISIFNNNAQIEDAISKSLKCEYSKTDMIIGTYNEKLNFNTICVNAKSIYEKLKIDDTNWLRIEDGYSEIFKFLDVNVIQE